MAQLKIEQTHSIKYTVMINKNLTFQQTRQFSEYKTSLRHLMSHPPVFLMMNICWTVVIAIVSNNSFHSLFEYLNSVVVSYIGEYNTKHFDWIFLRLKNIYQSANNHLPNIFERWLNANLLVIFQNENCGCFSLYVCLVFKSNSFESFQFETMIPYAKLYTGYNY